MKKIKCILLLLFLACFSTLPHLQAQGLSGFKLPNGLTVYIYEDNTKPDVYGAVGVKVGAINDPEELTGLAHYLEHMLFKGTEKIGTTDWEKEKPIYEQIIAKYDEMANKSDPVIKEAIGKEINQLTIEASKYAASNEFAALTERTGGVGLNAGTSWDYTIYYNSFPPAEIYRWLELNSERLIHPVFRAFQPELETVYEEYNRSQDEPGRQMNKLLLENIFPSIPYARPVIGLPVHLKNPRLSGLIEFYDKWYTPENMVLVLAGNIKASQVTPLIKDKFGRLQAKPSPERKQYPEWDLKGRKQVSAKLGNYPQILIAYKGVPAGHPDEIALEICTSILSNSNRTGLLDKLSLDGDVMQAYGSLLSFKEQGRVMLGAIPSYDRGQQRFASLGSTEKMVLKEVDKLQKGEIEEWLLNSVKGNMIRTFDLSFESSATKANMIIQAFINNEDIADVLNYKERVSAITMDEIKEIAKKYFTNDFIVLQLQEGKSSKSDKLEKPKYDPITPQRGAESAYAKAFANLPVRNVEPTFCDFNQIQSKPINQYSKLFYNKNPENNIFTLVLKYGVGTAQMPKLAYAVQLMNNAGIMSMYEPQELKQELSRLNASCRFSVNDSYLNIVVEGYEDNLLETCQLITRQILMPKLDEKQLNAVIGGELQGRRIEKERVNYLNSAIEEYLHYQDKSDFIDRLPLKDLADITISNLTGEFSRATDYEAEIHYVGSLPFDDVYTILSQNLPLKAQERKTESPFVKDYTQYAENTVYFLPESDAQQSGIYFLIDGKPFNIQDEVLYDAFNQYFSGSFNGLVMQEIREFRSMAYTAYGMFSLPPLQNKQTHLLGYIGTQPDKTIEAIETYLELLKELPKYPERIDNIKTYLKYVCYLSKPSFRGASQTYESWKKQGYDKDPSEINLPLIEQLTFDRLYQFYEKEVKGKPIAIAIVGDPKLVDAKQLEKFGKVVRLNKSKLFSSN